MAMNNADEIYRAASKNTVHGFSDLRGIHDNSSVKMIEKGHGVWVQAADGRLLLEASAGMWCASLGFGNESAPPATAVASRIWCASLGFGNESALNNAQVLDPA